MKKRVVISQSMYFPWVGFLEQVKLADVFVHYDDVQFSKGSFSNRVQVKTSSGTRWISIPLTQVHLGQKIDEIKLDERNDWRSQHRDILRQAYLKAPFRDEMLSLVDRVFEQPASTLADISRASIKALTHYFGLSVNRVFVDSKLIGISGSGSQRVLNIVLELEGTEYITGHGARNYLNHQLFEESGICVQYMEYGCIPYQQLHGDFTPYVSALDLIANCGIEGACVIRSETIDWKQFVRNRNERP